MTTLNIHFMDWLVNDSSRSKAAIKHEIKEQETRLAQLLKKSGEAENNELALVICNNLVGLYKELAIQEPKNEKNAHLYEDSPDRRFIRFMHSTDVDNCLISLINYWNECDLQSFESSRFFADCTDKEVRLWISFYSDKQYIQLFNAVFYYKLHPEELFDNKVHPEKLVSIQSRLDFIYQYIENLHRQLVFVANQKGITPCNDYLFHGDELPKGITFQVGANHKKQIQAAVKLWQNKSFMKKDKIYQAEQLKDLSLAYKFWFNPNRLIDAVMVLHQQLINNSTLSAQQMELFADKMIGLFANMNTVECLDLYGYFTNKDSTYLMRSLIALSENKHVDWMPPFMPSEHEAIQRVTSYLHVVMQSLRLELKNRNIETCSYPYEQPKADRLNPGQRIKSAIMRLITLYGGAPTSSNHIIDQFFLDIEQKGGV